MTPATPRGGAARSRLCGGRPPHPEDQGAELAVPRSRRLAHRRLAVAVLHPARDGEAAALRQQVGAAGRDRPARGLLGRGDRRRRAGGGARRARAPRGALGAGPCRHRRALQLQRSRAPLLPAGASPRWGTRDQPRPQARARPGEPRHRARHPRAAEGARRAARHRAQGRRAAAGTAGDGDAAGRDLPPGPRDAPRRRRKGRSRVPLGALRRRRGQFLRSAGAPAPGATISTDDADFYRVQEADVFDTLAILGGGSTVGYSHRGGGRAADPIRIEPPPARRCWTSAR